MATQADKFQKTSRILETKPLPEMPKIPEQIKNKFPDLKPHWEQFEQDLHKFFRESHFRDTNL